MDKITIKEETTIGNHILEIGDIIRIKEAKVPKKWDDFEDLLDDVYEALEKAKLRVSYRDNELIIKDGMHRFSLELYEIR
jgi:hypothetical protein